MSKYLTKSVAATISALLLLGCAAPAFAADAAVEKKETSYLILNTDGSVQEQITSDWLHSDDGFDAVTDESDLSDIQNLKSDVMPEQSGNTLKWTTDETDIYYQGKNSAQAPVGVSIEYTLDGKAVTADELKGQSGHLVATVKLTNNTGEEVTVNGKKRTVYTPFFTVAAAVLPSENFKNITTEHGLVESDSKTQVACYLAMPGMKEAVSDLLPDSFDKLDDLMLDTLTLEADVTDCTVPTFLFAAAPSLSDLDLDEVSDELGDTMDELTDAIDQLKEGSGALDDAVGTLVESLDTFASSYSQFDAGVDSDKLDGFSEITDPDSTLARVIDIMKDRADSFKGSGRADGTDMTVSYVMRTATDSSSNSTSTTEETTTETETKDSFWNRVANLFSK